MPTREEKIATLTRLKSLVAERDRRRAAPVQAPMQGAAPPPEIREALRQQVTQGQNRQGFGEAIPDRERSIPEATLNVLSAPSSGIVREGMNMADMIPQALGWLGQASAGGATPQADIPSWGGINTPQVEDIPLVGDALKWQGERKIPKGEKSIAGNLYDAGQTIGSWMLPMGKVTKLEPAMAGSAAAGEFIGKQFGGEGGGATGELVGGIGAFVAALASGSPQAIRNAIKSSDEEALMAFVRAKATNVDDAMTAIKQAKASGDVGTIADLTQDPGIAQIVNAVDPASVAGGKLKGLRHAREQQAVSRISSEFGEGATQTAEEMAGSRLAKSRAAIGQRKIATLAKAKQAATQDVAEKATAFTQAEKAVGGGRASEASKALQESWTTAKDKLAKEAVTPAWEAFGQSAKPINGEVVQRIVKSKGLNEQQLRIASINQTIKEMLNLEGVQSPEALHTLASDAKKLARKSAVPAERRVLNVLSSSIDEAIGSAGGNKKLYDAAKSMTVEARSALGGDVVYDAMKAGTPETIGKKLFKQGEEGAANAQALLNSEGVLGDAVVGQVENFIRSKLKSGNWTPKDLEKYDEFLTTWREAGGKRAAFVDSIDDIVSKSETLKTKSEGFEGLTKATEQQASKRQKGLFAAVERDALNKYRKGPKQFIRSALTSADGEKQLNALVKRFAGDPKGEAAIKRAIGDEVVELVSDSTGTRELLADPVKLEAFQKRLTGVLGEKGLKSVYNTTVKQRLTHELEKMGADGYKHTGEEATRLQASIGSALIMSSVKTGQSLILAGAVRRFIFNMLDHGITDRRLGLLGELAADPEQFVKAIESGLGAPLEKTKPRKVLDFLENTATAGGKILTNRGTARIATQAADDEE